MITLNDARDLLIGFFNNHKQINTVDYGDDLDFKSLTDVEYRLAHIEALDSNTSANKISYNFKIVIADRQSANDGASEQEIHNDTMLIAEDFITYFSHEDFELFEINENINIQTFTESNTDRIAGVVFSISCATERLKNICSVPLKGGMTFPYLEYSGGVERIVNGETDPIFTASPAYSITSEDISKWNTGGSGGLMSLFVDNTTISGAGTEENPLTAISTGVTYADIINKPALFSGNYNSLSDKPNLNSYLTGVTWGDVTNKPALFSGNYADLSNKPLLFDGNYYSLSNSPALFDGNYISLSNKPNLGIYLTGITSTNVTSALGFTPYNSTNPAGYITISAVTKTAVGLPLADNTSDVNKPVSTATTTALNLKVDKVLNKSLISDTEISRLSSVTNYVHPVNHPASIITQDINNRFVSDGEKINWNNAFSWGNHSGLYKLNSYVPTFTEVTSKPTTLAGYGITDSLSSNRTLTINGTAYDLSADRVWNIAGTNYSNLVTLNSDVVNTTVNYTDVTGLSFNVVAGTKYRFYIMIPYLSAAVNGSRWSLNGVAFNRLVYTSTYTLTQTSNTTNVCVAYDFPATANATSIVGGNLCIIEGYLVPSVSGSVVVRFASETTSGVTAIAGATLEYW